MPLPKIWVLGAALLAALLVGLVGILLLQAPGTLIQEAGFTLERITPNADGEADVTEFRYTLSRNASIWLEFTNAEGQRYVFRDGQRRIGDDYAVLFSGIVEGFRQAEDSATFRIPGEAYDPALPLLETRLIPNGVYTWTFRASADNGDEETRSGTLEVADADALLPLIQSFEVAPDTFTPNQDGINDRVSVNVFLAKAATLQVFLEDEAGVSIYLPRREGARAVGEEGNHEYDYDGGVDDGYRPPPDGIYTVHAIAQDAAGQRVSQTRVLQIGDGGLPQVEIMPQPSGATVCFDVMPYDEAYFSDAETMGNSIPLPDNECAERTTLTLQQGDLLAFRLTIRNYGESPIRTAGPFPGTVYQFGQMASTLGYLPEAGAWRVGIECETATSSYPWRWAVGSLDDLTEVYDPALDATLYYLEPGGRSEVWGAVRMTTLFDNRNPQQCWAALIHEDVGIPPRQNNVGRREVELVAPMDAASER